MPKPLPTSETDGIDSLRSFAKIRLIVADLDGTLLAPSSSRVFDTIRALSAALRYYKYKVALTIATGRTLLGVSRLLTDLDIPIGMPIILYNGSIVLEHCTFTQISKQVISHEALVSILSLALQHDAITYAYIYDEQRVDILSNIPPECVLGWSARTQPAKEINGSTVLWQPIQTVSPPISPSAILIDTQNDTATKNSLGQAINNIRGITHTSSGSRFIEVRPDGSNKGTALKSLAHHLKMPIEDILALGDGDNDSEMLAAAGIGVSVATASPAALNSSDYFCKYGPEEGVVELLRLIKAAKRYFQALHAIHY